MNATGLAAIKRYHLVRVWTPSIWTVAAGLAADSALAGFEVDPRLRLAATGAFLCVALGARLFSRETVHTTARWLDSKLGSQNRLEALVEVSTREDALAAAIKAEAGSFLRPRRFPLPYVSLAGVVVLLGLVSHGFVASARPSAPPTHPSTSPAASAAGPDARNPEATDLPPPASPWAQIVWLTPDADTTAVATETLPLRAEADSASGLIEATLAVAVNGGWRAPTLIMAAIGAGPHDIETVLPLDAYSAKEGDVLAYHVTAQRLRGPDVRPGPDWPLVTSALQVVRIMSADEGTAGVPVDDELERQLNHVQQLRKDQVSVLRDVFALDHEMPPRADPGWKDLIDLAGSREQTVRDRALQLSNAAMPAADKAALVRASTKADEAARLLSANTPGPAFLPAHQALIEIVAVEITTLRRVQEARAAAEKKPMETQAEGGLPTRDTTPAGRLERLAAEQGGVADLLAARAETPDTFAVQDRISREIRTLAEENAFDADMNTLISDAAASATEAARQLNEQDPVAATEPATRSSQFLADAVAKLEELSRKRVAEALLQAQRSLIENAVDIQFAEENRTAEIAATNEELERLSRRLAELAAREQSWGSQEAVKELVEFGKRAGTPQLDPADPAKAQEVLIQAAQLASDASTKLVNTPEDLTKAVDELNRAKASLEKKDLNREALKSLHKKSEAAMQRVRSLTKPEKSEDKKAPRDEPTDAREPKKSSASKEADEPPPSDAEKQPSKGDRKKRSAAGDDAEVTQGGGKQGGEKQSGGKQGGAGGGNAGAGGSQRGNGGTKKGPGRSAPSGESQGLAERIEGTLRQANTALREAKRAHVLTTGNPAEAPPAYRPAVADYFESLARGSGGVTRPSTPPQNERTEKP